MVASTGIVVVPYNEYPQLLAILLRLLSEGQQPLRISVVKVRAERQDPSAPWTHRSRLKQATACLKARAAGHLAPNQAPQPA